jgi:hypothetical protein
VARMHEVTVGEVDTLAGLSRCFVEVEVGGVGIDIVSGAAGVQDCREGLTKCNRRGGG